MAPKATAPNPTPSAELICSQPNPSPRARAGSDSAAIVHTIAASALRKSLAANWAPANAAASGASAVRPVATV